ncbi:hypothetical protein C8F01DRAFT_1098526 [Mycena amicta]|nr:hypothetical protein C8F01DRAFT_1098526 [Mycena amicta]
MHIRRSRLPAGQATSHKAKRLSNSGWANAPAYDKNLQARQQEVVSNSAVVFTGNGFTFTLDGPVTLTVPAGNGNDATTTSTTAPLSTTTTTTPLSTPTLPAAPPATDTPADPIVSLTSGIAPAPPGPPSPIASAINPGSNASSANPNGDSAAQNGDPVSGVSTNKPHGLPTGAIVGIALAIVVLVLGAFVFLVRQRSIRQRQLRRATAGWPTGAAGFAQPPPQPAGTYQDAERMGEQSPGVTFARAQAAALAVPAPPPSAYGAVAAVPGATSGGSTATVRYEFIPSLPDELSIVTGEVVRIVAEYDDGWALCANSRNEQGMVPIECIDRNSNSNSRSTLAPGQGNRNSRRTSSLAMGVRY